MYYDYKYLNINDICKLKDFIDSIINHNTTGIVLLVAENTPFSYQEFQNVIRNYTIPICGGIVPGIIYNGEVLKEGVLALSFNKALQITPFISFDHIDNLTIHSANFDTCLLLVDGLSSGIGEFLNKLHSTSSHNRKFIGGGTGRLTLLPEPSLFTQDNYWCGGGIIINIDTKFGIGVNHGWQILHGPLVANKSSNHLLYEINWQPSFQYYAQIIESEVGLKINPDNFFDIAKQYPFGMIRSDGTVIVRDPIAVHDNNGLKLVGEIPQNSVLAILKGETDLLIKAATQAASDAHSDYEKDCHGRAPKSMLLIDCISRVLFLEDNISKEIIASGINNLPINGFFSLGEIASLSDKYLEFLNKTIVIGVG